MIIKPRLKPNMAPKRRMKRILCHPPIFSGLTLGSEIKARGTEMAKKAEKEKKTESNWNKFAAIVLFRRSFSMKNLSKCYMTMFRLEYRDNQCFRFHHLYLPVLISIYYYYQFRYQQPSLLISETNVLWYFFK